MRSCIYGGRVIDPANGRDEVADVYIDNEQIVAIGNAPDDFTADQRIDATGQWVLPGIIDLCARPREPGDEHKGTIASECSAAVSAGITTLCCPPDTDPVIDTPAVVELITQRAERAGKARVLTLGALTKGLQGELLSSMGALKEAGCRGVSNALQHVPNTEVLRRAMEYAATFDLTVFLHAEDHWLHNNGLVHEGAISSRLGLAGIPVCAETVDVARCLLLIEQIGVRAHFCRLSSAKAVDMIQTAQQQGLPVSADVAASYLHLSVADLGQFDSNCLLRPPLRTLADQARLRGGIGDGTIGVICSDHQPHESEAKDAPLGLAEPGMSAIETLLPLALQLVDDDGPALHTVIAALTSGPATVLGLDSGHLGVGAQADICVWNPDSEWRLDAEQMISAGKNTPFLGRTFRGEVSHTWVGGRQVFQR